MSETSPAQRNMTIVALQGNLDAQSAPERRRQLKEVIADGGTLLALDLSGVKFMDSMGLAVLLTALKLARNEGGDVVLLRPIGQVRFLLELTRLDRIFAVCEDEATAEAKLAKLAR